MRVIEIPKTLISPSSTETPLEKTFESVFCKETLVRIHGPSVKVSNWRGNSRKVSFAVPVTNIPKEIRRFFCGDKLRVTANQTKEAADAGIRVTNRLRLHFFGAELFKIRAIFNLTQEACGTYIHGHVEHWAYLPPPAKAVAEAFMVNSSQREMDNLSKVIRT